MDSTNVLTDQKQATQFLDKLFREKPDDTYILIWGKNNKNSYYFAHSEKAAEKACQLASKGDVYVGVVLSPKKFGKKKRTKKSKAAGIGGMWLDIDYPADHRESDKNYPDDKDEALRILDESNLKPTWLIDSGHGLHAWWLFENLWMFNDDEERANAQVLAEHWQKTMQAHAGLHGYDLDSTYDFARIMRIPGTINHQGMETSVEFLEKTGARYTREDIKNNCISEVQIDLSPSSLESMDMSDFSFQLSRDASPPTDKKETLLSVDTKIKESWEHKRIDLQDQSASGYDMSLATFAVMSGWSNQEIVDLLIAHRRKHGESLNLDRPDYYARTIKKARKSAEEERHRRNVELLSDPDPEESGESDTESPPHEHLEGSNEEKLQALCDAMGVPYTRLVKYESPQDPRYALETDEQEIFIGDVKNLDSQTRFRRKMMNQHGIVITNKKGAKFDTARWMSIVQALLDTAKVVEKHESETMEEHLQEWVGNYLKNRSVTRKKKYDPGDEPDRWKALADRNEPFTNEEGTFIHLDSFIRYLKHSYDIRQERQDLGPRLKSAGFEKWKKNIKYNGERQTLRYWKLPENWWL